MYGNSLPCHASLLLGLGPSCSVTKKPWRCEWRPEPVGSFHPSQVSTAPGKPKHPYIAQSRHHKNNLTFIFLCFAGEKRNTHPPPNGVRDQQSKLPLYEHTLLSPHIHWGKICRSGCGASSAAGDYQSGCCLAGAADAVGTQYQHSQLACMPAASAAPSKAASAPLVLP